MPFILALRNLVHDKARLAATLSGLTFAVILVGVQVGLYLGVRKIVTAMVDHAHAQLWIVPFGAQSIEDAFPTLSDTVRHEALATPGVKRVVPLVISFADWDRPDGGLTHVVVVGTDPEDGGLAPWNLREGTWTDIKGYKGVGVDRTYLAGLGIAGVGSHAGIDFGPQSHSLRVKALTDGIRSFTQAPYVFTTAERARKFFGVPQGNSTFLLVDTAPGTDLKRVQKQIAARLSDVEVLTPAEFRDRSIRHWIFRTGVGVALILGTVLGIVIGVVIEAQTLYSATLDHIKEFAVLRMLGSSAGYVYRVILAQASIISFAGFVLGALGVVLVDRLSQATALPMVVPPLLFVAMLVAALLIGLVSASIAVTKVLRIDPASVLMR